MTIRLLLPLTLLLILFTSTESSILSAQSYGSAVSISLEKENRYFQNRSEFSFAWGNGVVTTIDGTTEAIEFQGEIVTPYQGCVEALISQPFVVDENTLAVDVDAAYQFIVESLGVPKRDEGYLSILFEIYDVETGKVHPRMAYIFEPHDYDIPMDQSSVTRSNSTISIPIRKEWIEDGPRRAALRVVLEVPTMTLRHPELVMNVAQEQNEQVIEEMLK